MYDENGARIAKKSYNPTTGVLLQTTWYVGGMIYVQTGTGNPVPEEYAIDAGGDRLGTFYRQDNVYAYELRDQLGNVRATIAQSGTTLEVRGYSDYYPYGMVLRSGGTTYRYGYQGAYAEKDGETDWNAFELRMYDSRIARWLTTDPAGQFASPYIAMGGDPVNGVDKDGGEADWHKNADGSESPDKGDHTYIDGVDNIFDGNKWIPQPIPQLPAINVTTTNTFTAFQHPWGNGVEAIQPSPIGLEDLIMLPYDFVKGGFSLLKEGYNLLKDGVEVTSRDIALSSTKYATRTFIKDGGLDAGKANTLFHYTNEAGYNAIIKSDNLLPSIGIKNARYGPGQYLTDIAPGQFTIGQTSRRLFGVPWNKTYLTHYFEIDVSGLNVIKNAPFNYVIPGTESLPLGGRIISHGTSTFQ